MKLVVGLGNPGKQYARTRHNVGWRVLDAMVTADWKTVKNCQALIVKQADVLYAKPVTFMNESGIAVAALLHYYHLTTADLCIVYDDKDLPFGTIRFRNKGSAGGHNGMKSIIQHIGTENFARLRIGIAPDQSGMIIHDTADYVLSKFTTQEEQALPKIIEQACKKIKTPTNLNAWAESNDSLH
ncbi:MAG: aminoacyl-tRNA hydrolase [Candidatus Kerfeldbacteria bacterium]|nr:aminoacyl-tRNA hydrolase [Candidatus Kerfeldbacteria bacterium]